MNEKTLHSWLGYVAMVGGVASLLLAPVMVVIKYMTGWAIVPQPSWVAPVREVLGDWLRFAPPTELWTAYGTAYTVALLLMFLGFLGLMFHLRRTVGRIPSIGYWLVLVGLVLVIPGDAIHSWTWHQNGLQTPTPGTNPLANTAYAVHMMGMNILMAGCLIIGISAWRRKTVAPWLGWSFLFVFPAAVLASITLLPTTPSGALWWFSTVMLLVGYCLATGRERRLSSVPV